MKMGENAQIVLDFQFVWQGFGRGWKPVRKQNFFVPWWWLLL